jgi:hypothetical protein
MLCCANAICKQAELLMHFLERLWFLIWLVRFQGGSEIFLPFSSTQLQYLAPDVYDLHLAAFRALPALLAIMVMASCCQRALMCTSALPHAMLVCCAWWPVRWVPGLRFALLCFCCR